MEVPGPELLKILERLQYKQQESETPKRRLQMPTEVEEKEEKQLPGLIIEMIAAPDQNLEKMKFNWWFSEFTYFDCGCKSRFKYFYKGR